MIVYLGERHCKIDIKANMEIDEIHDYLSKLKNDFDSGKEVEMIEQKTKSYDEMTIQEKLDFLRQERERLIDSKDEEGPKLERKKESNNGR